MMPSTYHRKARWFASCLLVACALLPKSSYGFLFTGQASELTQLLNNAELVRLSGQSAQQVEHQLTQISQLAEQIQNQFRIYENLLENTKVLPSHVWGQVEADLMDLARVVTKGEGLAFSMSNIETALKQRFQSFAEFESGLEEGKDFSEAYRVWSHTNRETIAATLRAAGLTADQFGSEEATMGQLRRLSESAVGHMQALQIGHDIAAQQVAQTQKLRGLLSQQVTFMATWYQSEQAAKDLARAQRERFFSTTPLPLTGGQVMEPRW